jgi:hypothetical protein
MHVDTSDGICIMIHYFDADCNIYRCFKRHVSVVQPTERSLSLMKYIVMHGFAICVNVYGSSTGMQNIIWMTEPFMAAFCMFAMLLRWNLWQKPEQNWCRGGKMWQKEHEEKFLFGLCRVSLPRKVPLLQLLFVLISSGIITISFCCRAVPLILILCFS